QAGALDRDAGLGLELIVVAGSDAGHVLIRGAVGLGRTTHDVHAHRVAGAQVAEGALQRLYAQVSGDGAGITRWLARDRPVQVGPGRERGVEGGVVRGSRAFGATVADRDGEADLASGVHRITVVSLDR